jgi:hypothetical protein
MTSIPELRTNIKSQHSQYPQKHMKLIKMMIFQHETVAIAQTLELVDRTLPKPKHQIMGIYTLPDRVLMPFPCTIERVSILQPQREVLIGQK